MRQDPFGRGGQQNQAPQRRSPLGNVRWWILLAFAGYAAFYWFSNQVVDPYTGEKGLIDSGLTVEDEKTLGLQAYREILSQETPLDPNAPASLKVREIAQKLVSKVGVVGAALAEEHGVAASDHAGQYEWAVSVIDSPQANAFCLPGGKMAVYTGLFPVAQNDDALAVVMGHEIAHALSRHGAQRMAQQKVGQIVQMGGAASGMDASSQQMVMAAMGYGVLLPYAREHETQADEVGLLLAAAACFDPNEAIPLWQRMSEASGGQAPPEFSSTHPNPGTRIQNLQALLPKAMEYRQRFCEEAGAP